MPIIFKQYTILSMLIVCITCKTHSQQCNCTISQVSTNTVTPCRETIGTVIRVKSVQEFQSAINQANTKGGNMSILIEDGIYHVATSASHPYITASKMVIRSASGNRDKVILHGDGMKSVDPNTEVGLNIVGNDVLIADLTIRDVGNHGIQIGGHRIKVYNVRIQNTYQQMIKGASGNPSIDSVIVQCSLFEYTNNSGPNYYIGGIDVHKGNAWIVRDNLFKNIISPSGSVAEHAIHFWNNSANTLVERNQIINCDRGIGFGLGTSPHKGGIIRNNMIYNNGNGTFNDVGIGLESSPDTKVYNNTIFIAYNSAIEYRFNSTTNVQIINNLTNKVIKSRDGGIATLTTNVINAQSNWFVNTSTGNLRLNSAIPSAYDQGTSLASLLIDDIDQQKRPQGNGIDIGAHEYSTLTQNSNLDTPIDISIFPNPSNGYINFISERKINNIEIYNLQGILKMQQAFSNSSTVLNTNQLHKGIYWAKIFLEDKYLIMKMVVVL
ncbi:MAG: T9SS type A sorting domain-containing protein [Saprospiraceae bacterium]